MLLWVIRHADAVRSSRYADDDRPLSDLGTAQSLRLAAYVRGHRHPSIIWSSPLRRAQQTAETIAANVPPVTVQVVEFLGPGASVRSIIDELQNVRSTGCALVGHEPMMSALVSRLLSGDDSTHVRFSPSTAVLLEAEGSIGPGTFRLLECVSPELLESLLPPLNS